MLGRVRRWLTIRALDRELREIGRAWDDAMKRGAVEEMEILQRAYTTTLREIIEVEGSREVRAEW